MSTSKRRAIDDVSEQGDAVNLSGASALWHADRTRADDPCPKTSCACPGELHSSAPPAPPGIEQSCKAQKNSHAQQVGQDMEKKEMDISPIPPKRYNLTTASSACAHALVDSPQPQPFRLPHLTRLCTDRACESAAGHRRVSGAITLIYKR